MAIKSNDLLINKISYENIQRLSNNERLFSRFVSANEKFFHNIVNKFSTNYIFEHEDYYQISLMCLYNVIDGYNPDRGSLSTFLYKCIYNDILQLVNKSNTISSKETSIEIFTRNVDGGESTEYNEMFFKDASGTSFEDNMVAQLEVSNFMNKLESIHKEIFDKRIIKKMKHEDVAKAMGLNYHTYKHLWHYSVSPKIKQLQELLAG